MDSPLLIFPLSFIALWSSTQIVPYLSEGAGVNDISLRAKPAETEPEA